MAGISDVTDRVLGATQRVYRGILQDLDEGAIVPGQRLVEVELAAQYGVGRNAVREAMQQLAGRGIVDLSRHRSAAIRKFTLDEALDVLDVALAMNRLIARTAALRYDSRRHAAQLQAISERLDDDKARDSAAFGRTRRAFYRALLEIGSNAELIRLFPSVGIHIVHAQFRITRLDEVRMDDYRAIIAAVECCDVVAAEIAAERHVARIRDMIMAAAR